VRVLMAVDEVRRLAEPRDEGFDLRCDFFGETIAIEQTKALNESEETGEPLPEPPPRPEQDQGAKAPVGAGGPGKAAEKIAGPKPTQLPASKPAEKKG